MIFLSSMSPEPVVFAEATRIFYSEIGSVIAVVAYLLGSIPFGYLVGKTHGMDIREHGSGNIGATNVRRTLGKGPGNLVFICDVLKGVIAVVLAKIIAGTAHLIIIHDDSFVSGGAKSSTVFFPMAVAAVLAAVCCILGHNFPVWLKFKGGKGIATSAGVMIGMMPLVAVLDAAVWAAVFYATGYVSLGSIVAAVAIPIIVIFMLMFGWMTGWPYFYFGIVACVLAVWRHRANIGRLMAGTEPRAKHKQAESATVAEEK